MTTRYGNRACSVALTLALVTMISAACWAAPMTAEEGAQVLKAAISYATVVWEMDGVQHVGVPYVWGGRITADEFLAAVETGDVAGLGVDASGLIIGALHAVRPQASFQVKRGDDVVAVANVASDALFRWNVMPVTVEQLRPGDFIFFAGTDGTINGVAIYERMAGRNVRFVVASANSGRVVQTSANLDGEYWATRFAGAGRFVWSEAGE